MRKNESRRERERERGGGGGKGGRVESESESEKRREREEREIESGRGRPSLLPPRLHNHARRQTPLFLPGGGRFPMDTRESLTGVD